MNKKRIKRKEITFVAAIVIICVNSTLASLPGSGTEQDPWRIESLTDFNEFAGDPNYWDDYTRLKTDLNLAGITYTTAVIAPYPGTTFTGVFDGNDHKIINLTVDTDGADNTYLGLFGWIVAGGDVRNLGLENVSIIGGDRSSLLGGMCGLNDGTINNCYSEGTINGYRGLGGLCGNNSGSISNCYSNCDVSGTDWQVGGLVGFNRGSVLDCYSIGDVNGGGGVGGLVGYNDRGDVLNCYSTGSVRGVEEVVGGLVGRNYVASVMNCYSTGNVSSSSSVGGLVGFNYVAGSVFNSYSTGDVSGDIRVGCLVGANDSSISNCFWDTDTQTHGVTNGIGINGGTVTNVEGLPTEQMQTKSTFTDAGWDFVEETINGPNDIWRLCEDLMHYPRFAWQFPLGDFLCPDGVDFIDYSFFALHWQEDNCDASNDCDGTDLDQLGTVDVNDLAIFFDNWLAYPSPIQASDPNPTNGEINVSTTADLSWIVGLYATSHDVYFGTSNPPPFIGNQMTTIFNPSTMDYNTTYYWRIDEVNSSGTTTGIVWNFTTLSSPPP